MVVCTSDTKYFPSISLLSEKFQHKNIQSLVKMLVKSHSEKCTVTVVSRPCLDGADDWWRGLDRSGGRRHDDRRRVILLQGHRLEPLGRDCCSSADGRGVRRCHPDCQTHLLGKVQSHGGKVLTVGGSVHAPSCRPESA